MQRAEGVHRLEAPPSAPPAGGGKATWQPRAWGLGSGPCPRLSGTLSCLASLPSTQIIGADGSSSASYLRRTLAKCVPGSWDGSPPRQPSSGKFFRKLDSGCVGLPPSLFFRKAPARPWEAQFPGSPAVPPGLDLGENVVGMRAQVRDRAPSLTNRRTSRRLLNPSERRFPRLQHREPSVFPIGSS